MTIKMTIEEIEIMLQSELIEAIRADLPPKASYWIGRGVDKAQGIYRVYLKERNKIQLKYAELDEQGEMKFVDKVLNGKQVREVVFKSDADKRECMDEIDELAKIEEDLGIEKIVLDWDKLEERWREGKITTSPMVIMPIIPLLEPPK